MSTVKLAVLIPTRGDRPRFLANCLRMIKGQTLQPDHIEVVDDAPNGSEKDITRRYRLGYDRLRNKGLDVIALIEDDDFYRPEYLSTMVAKWLELGRPDLLGTTYTIYYHIRLFAYFTMHHHTRSSAMSTLIRPDLNFEWCPDSEVYTDIWLWHSTNLKGKTFKPDQHLCLGIKHGVGQTGGFAHVSKLNRYTGDDRGQQFLRSVCDPTSFAFYSQYFNQSV